MRHKLIVILSLVLWSFPSSLLPKIAYAESLSLIADTEWGFFSHLTTVNDDLYFTESKTKDPYNPNYKTQMWRFKDNQLTQVTNNSSDITKSTKHAFGFYPYEMISDDLNVYFTAHSDKYGHELWQYDGNKLYVIDIFPGKLGSSPKHLILYRGNLNFTVGRDLYKYDGENVVKVASIPRKVITFGPLCVFQDRIYLGARYNSFDGGLWKYDGKDISVDIDVLNSKKTKLSTYYPRYFTVSNNELFFYLEGGYELWKYDGKRTSFVMKIMHMNYEESINMIAYKNSLYFRADDGIHGYELWKYDGEKVSIVADLREGRKSSHPKYMTVFNGYLYFFAIGGLYKYDGNQIFKVIDQNTGTQVKGGRNLVAGNNVLYFSKEKSLKDRQLWQLKP